MSRKDYEVIADALGTTALWAKDTSVSKAYLHSQYGGVRMAVDALIKFLKEDNPKFNEKEFIATVYHWIEGE